MAAWWRRLSTREEARSNPDWFRVSRSFTVSRSSRFLFGWWQSPIVVTRRSGRWFGQRGQCSCHRPVDGWAPTRGGQLGARWAHSPGSQGFKICPHFTNENGDPLRGPDVRISSDFALVVGLWPSGATSADQRAKSENQSMWPPPPLSDGDRCYPTADHRCGRAAIVAPTSFNATRQSDHGSRSQIRLFRRTVLVVAIPYCRLREGRQVPSTVCCLQPAPRGIKRARRCETRQRPQSSVAVDVFRQRLQPAPARHLPACRDELLR